MYIGRVLAAIIWIVGIIVAKGFWSTFFAVIIPIYAWYLAISAFLMPYLEAL